MPIVVTYYIRTYPEQRYIFERKKMDAVKQQTSRESSWAADRIKIEALRNNNILKDAMNAAMKHFIRIYDVLLARTRQKFKLPCVSSLEY